MAKAKSDHEAWQFVLSRVSKSELARCLAVSRQLTSRWHTVPPRYADEVARVLGIPISEVTPELHAAVSSLIGRDATPVLPQLIALLSEKNGHSPGRPKKRK